MHGPSIVAEVSANHLGRLDRAIQLIDCAADVGADAVKFQCWSRYLMVLDRGYTMLSGPWKGRTLAELYEAAHTPQEWFETLFRHARARGIDCFASVFDVESLAFLEGLGCEQYKIASFEITDLSLIKAVASTGKPIIISCGMATQIEIAQAVRAARWAAHITLLKCTSAYPATAGGANLMTMVDMAREHADDGISVGLSDHTLGSAVSVAAAALGAQMIEKHLTIRRCDGGPDAGFSLEPAEFGDMVLDCAKAAVARGLVHYGPGEDKDSMIFRRSVYASDDIAAGEWFTKRNVRTARLAVGIPASRLSSVIGKRAVIDIARGKAIQPADVSFYDHENPG